jgi:hypothetical protein
MTSIMVATPMYGGMCTGPYVFSLLWLRAALAAEKIEMHYSFIMNEALIQRARNSQVHMFLKTECTHLLFIDADIKFNGPDVLSMLKADKDIICGLYPLKHIDWNRVHQAANNGVPADQLKHHSTNVVANLLTPQTTVTVEEGVPYEVKDAGTGFMLIKRHVFEKLSETVPSYINNTRDLGGGISPMEKIKEFFATSIDPETGVLLSEDYHLCDLWRKAGGQIFVAPWVQLGHIGAYQFDR